VALVLIGFMGAGKSTAAAELARRRGGRALDTDRMLEAELSESIAAAFAREGESAFRAREERTVLRALDRAGPRDAVALGGGAPTIPAVRAALRKHTVAYLQLDADTAWRRVSTSPTVRPLARDPVAFRALHRSREPIYAAAADAYLPGDEQLDPMALDAAASLPDRPRGTRLVWARAASGSHPVWVGRGLLRPGVDWGPGAGACWLVADERVIDLHAARLPVRAGELLLAAGEEHKTLDQAQRVWRWLAESGATRADAVVALGGGVIGDLAGFCAATYQRGVPVVQVPTTLVAQVDSALGGKTGVDLPEAKNYVGAYHQPAEVLVDPELLETLADAEQAAGYAEVVKTALIAGGSLWDRVRAGAAVDEQTIVGCVRTKLGVVAGDERDADSRQVLNLGHTIGHALETVTSYARLRHGEAVGLGLLACLRLSGAEALRSEVGALLAAAGLPVRLDGVDPEAVLLATRRDKKRLGPRVPFVLLAEPGCPQVGRDVDDDAVRAAVEELTR